jgi:hypothetical protein
MNRREFIKKACGFVACLAVPVSLIRDDGYNGLYHGRMELFNGSAGQWNNIVIHEGIITGRRKVRFDNKNYGVMCVDSGK